MRVLALIRNHLRSTPVVLLALTLAAYGPLIPWLGFYWDDWPKAWFLHRLGPFGFDQVYALDRPVLGWVYLLTTPWIGESPLAWQAFGLFCRWLSALAMGWMMAQVLPGRARTAAIAGMTFLVYPGFGQQFISLIYSHYFLLLAAHLASLGWMIWLVRRGEDSIRRHAGPLVLAALSLFSVEYFLGIELIRPLILLFPLLGSGSGLRRWAKVGAPYLVLMVGFLVWRVSVVSFPTYEPTLLQEFTLGSAGSVSGLVETVASDMGEAGLGAWGHALTLPDLSKLGGFSTLGWGAVGLTALALAVIHVRSVEAPILSRGRRNPVGWLLIAGGGLSLAVSGWPFWVTELPMGLQFPWDRLTLPMMMGSALVVTGLVEVLPGGIWPKLLLTGILVGGGAAHQFENATSYRRDWAQQREFLWQLAWRAPSIEPGTAVLTNDIPLLYESDNSLTAPLNWMYAPDSHTAEMEYVLYFVSVRFGRGLPGVERGLPIQQSYRAARFEGSTSQVLVLFYDPPGCVRFLDLVQDDSMHNLPAPLSRWVPLSDLSLIRSDGSSGARPPSPVGGEEPPHGWCYFFEQADLARQNRDWERVVELGEQARALGDRPKDAAERIPFIEGYAHLGRWDRAQGLSQDSIEQEGAVRPMICNAWRRIAAEGPPSEADRIQAIVAELGCG
ncbi:MAG: hypothetical protein WD906_05995 [Anaerolineales bacterium]